MIMVSLALFASSLLGAALVLHGCGSGGGDHGGGPKTTVVLMRHCVRDTGNHSSWMAKAAGYGYYNNYSNEEWPEFGVPHWWNKLMN